MTQYARPTSDFSAADWTATPLWSKIDEVVADDGDFVSSLDNTNNVAEVSLSSLIDPLSSSGHIVRYRYAKSASGGNARNVSVALIDRSTSTLIAELLHSNISEVWTAGTYTLSGAQADSIADYSQLTFQLKPSGTITGTAGNRRAVQVSWVELEIPGGAPAAPTGLTATVFGG